MRGELREDISGQYMCLSVSSKAVSRSRTRSSENINALPKNPSLPVFASAPPVDKLLLYLSLSCCVKFKSIDDSSYAGMLRYCCLLIIQSVVTVQRLAIHPKAFFPSCHMSIYQSLLTSPDKVRPYLDFEISICFFAAPLKHHEYRYTNICFRLL